MNGFDLSTLSELYVGSTPYSAIYKGSNLIWSAVKDYSREYLTIEPLEDNCKVYLTKSDSSGADITIQYSKNKTTWYDLTSAYSSDPNLQMITVNNGENLYFKAKTTSIAFSSNSNYYTFYATKSYNVSGNIMSLLYSDTSFIGKTEFASNSGANYVFKNLFSGVVGGSDLINSLRSAENLILPATKLREGCYNSMFVFQNGMTKSPVSLPATTLTASCYSSMFQGCTALTTTPTITVSNGNNYSLESMFKNCSSLVSVSNMTLKGTYQSPQNMFYGCSSLVSAANITLKNTNAYSYRYMFSGCTSLTTPPTMPTDTNLSSKWEPFVQMFYGCSSLTTAPSLPATTLVGGCYRSMFEGCSSLTTAPSLPATTLTSECYKAMFKNCTSLVNVPASLPSSINSSCFYSMFEGCTSLTTAPELPATTLNNSCYRQMFQGCTSLTTAPELPAETVPSQGYYNMFYGCKNLNNIKCLATDISATYCVANWVSLVKANGTFTKAASMTSWPSGPSGIPSSWTVVDATS